MDPKSIFPNTNSISQYSKYMTKYNPCFNLNNHKTLNILILENLLFKFDSKHVQIWASVLRSQPQKVAWNLPLRPGRSQLGVRLCLLSQIDNYAITQKLGRGKYSHVFEANDKKHRRNVAIKVLLPIKPDKIKREYLIHKMLNHPNIIKLHDIVRCPK